MLRILAERLDRGHIKRMSTLMPFSYMTGTTVTWILVGAIASVDNWRTAFWLPGFAVAWRLGILAKGGHRRAQIAIIGVSAYHPSLPKCGRSGLRL